MAVVHVAKRLPRARSPKEGSEKGDPEWRLYVCVYIYIYIHRGGDYVYIYIYIYIHRGGDYMWRLIQGGDYMCIYIYTHTQRDKVTFERLKSGSNATIQ